MHAECKSCNRPADIGVRVPDVAWASEAFLKAHGEATPYPRAPEIRVEIVSAANTEAEMQEKTRAYLAAGAEIVIAKNGVPRAKLVPLGRVGPLKFGVLKGKLRYPDDFDAPLPEAVLARFEGRRKK